VEDLCRNRRNLRHAIHEAREKYRITIQSGKR
jgi:hypothetical protein